VSGLASGGSATTLVDDTFANIYPDDYFNNWIITTHDGTGKNGYAVVTDFTGSTCTFTVADWLSASDKSTAAAADPAASTSYFVTDGLKHPAGQMFDTQREFGQLDFDAVGEYLNKDLPEAHRLDGRMRPRVIGVMQSGSYRGYRGTHQPRQHRSWTNVVYN
jgi:hypothetical protein